MATMFAGQIFKTSVNARKGMRAVLMATALTALVAGCAEEEEILRGVREEIRPDALLEVENKSVAFAAPKQVANRSWAQSPGQADARTDNAALSQAPALLWSVNIGQGDSRKQRITAAPIVAGGLIYTLDSGARVSAVSPEGAVVWQKLVLPPNDDETQATGGGMAYADGVIYVSSGFGLLTALNAETGAQIWQQKLGGTGSGQPTVHGGLVYLVSGDAKGWAVNTKDGRIAWQIEATETPSNVLGAPAPVVTSDLSIFAFGSGDIVATFKRGGFRRWGAAVSGRREGSVIAQVGDVTGAPFVQGSRMYVANQSGRTVAFDVDKGTRIWTAPEGATGPLWAAGDSVFLVSDLNNLLRLSASTGEIIWSQPLARFLKDKPGKRAAIVAHHGPILTGGQLAVASGDGALRFFDPKDGSLTHSVAVKGGATTEPVVAGRTLYVVTRDGDLAAYR
ncbi:Outer membrane protein assembly factor BamB precursor [Tritonibacter multivorans]|uniref:Outer membrane protein assembly factor BamB n=2 Tax=Tritonibacter multivorans TaxID=928856 RepID=A0A0P1GHX0_9RHOB|nr:Outer membrane protein assembly factor BamB precursor [Tritonibacter multivorans]SFC36510.1 Outer membrane protein assembly factor BamB, contains PQQ-like beta-propeller repeat [Tritonibacter multivorans]